MDIDETARFELHEGLREVLGERRGDTLMSMLSPVGWANVATKDDLSALEDRLAARLHQEMNRQIWAMIGSLLALAAVLTANNIW